MTANTLTSFLEVVNAWPSQKEVSNAVSSLKKRNPDSSCSSLVSLNATQVVWRMTGVGIVASLPGAFPGLGTALQLTIGGVVLSGETWLLLRNLTMLQLITASLCGYNPKAIARKEEAVIIWGLVMGLIQPATVFLKDVAAQPAKVFLKDVAAKVASRVAKKGISGRGLQNMNRRVGISLLSKFGAKRSASSFGRAIPLGVGVIIGGAMNYVMARSFAKLCVSYYRAREVVRAKGEPRGRQ